MNPAAGPDPSQARLKKRKLRQPRATRACAFCRKRKVRCSGTRPCEYCVREEAICTDESAIERPSPIISTRQESVAEIEATTEVSNGGLQRHVSHFEKSRPQGFELAIDGGLQPYANHADVARNSVPKALQLEANGGLQPLARKGPIPNIALVESDQAGASTGGSTSRASRRNSLEPQQSFAEGQHIGPTSGVSFLYHPWNRDSNTTVEAHQRSHVGSVPMVLTSHGDFPQVKMRVSESPLRLPTAERASVLLERYFRFATPTYRFLHRPTIEDWNSQLLAGLGGSQVSVARSACVWLAWAQSLLYTSVGDRYANGGDQDLNTSRAYYEKAKTMLVSEPGPASLASVQARLAMCLYLLSTFRINECRFCFSFASEILTSLGLHRRLPKSHKLDLVESESRKRTFWCAYVLDGYLSVMLGRPRLLRDEDVDQPFPRNLDDQDILSSEAPQNLPLHGNLEAFIWHAELAKLMGRNNDSLYPLHSLKEEEVLVRTSEMIELLDNWRDQLPDFLKPRDRTLTGQRTFERQNTVLKLAHAHLRILITRRCLLTDFNRFGRSISSYKWDSRAIQPICECVAGITTIIGVACDLTQRGSLYQSFWFTQYIALVAISTLYVFVIQGAQNALPAPADTFLDVEDYLVKAKQCQQDLAAMAPEGSQARRHHRLLDQLRTKAERDLLKKKNRSLNPSAPTEDNYTNTATKLHNTDSSTLPESTSLSVVPAPLDLCLDVNDGQPYSGLFTPSEEDFTFQNILDCGWESLDTIGFPTNIAMYDYGR